MATDSHPLKAARKRTAEQLRTAVLDDTVSVSALKDISERLKQIDAVLDAQNRRSRQFALIGSALAVGLLVSALATFKTFTTQLDAAVVATAVDLHFSVANDLPDLVLEGPVTVSGIRHAESGTSRSDGELSGADGLRLTARETRLQSLHVAEGATLRIETGSDYVALSIAHPSQTLDALIATDGLGQLTAVNSAAPTWKQAFALTDVDLVHLSNGPGGGKAVPVRIAARRMTSFQTISLKGVDQASFTRPGLSKTSAPEAESSILQGLVRVGPKMEDLRLESGDRLSVSNLDLRQMRLGLCETASGDSAPVGPKRESRAASEPTCPGLTLRMTGTTTDVQAAGPGPLRSLKPTWLVFLKDNALVALLWTSAAFVWGIGWAIWRALQK